MAIDVVGTKRWDILENIRRMGCEEVAYEYKRTSLSKNKKDIQIILPLTGYGSRFRSAGYK